MLLPSQLTQETQPGPPPFFLPLGVCWGDSDFGRQALLRGFLCLTLDERRSPMNWDFGGDAVW